MLWAADLSEADLESAAQSRPPVAEPRGVKRTHRGRRNPLTEAASQPEWAKPIWLSLQNRLLSAINNPSPRVARYDRHVRVQAWATEIRRAFQWILDRVEEYLHSQESVLDNQLRQATGIRYNGREAFHDTDSLP